MKRQHQLVINMISTINIHSFGYKKHKKKQYVIFLNKLLIT